jgi:hypothetical protein
MGIRLPQNQAVTSKYTSGKEYMFNSTYREYIGYYYELNGKLFAGKEFNANALELIKIDSSKTNKLLTNASTYVYGKISGTRIPNQKPVSHIFKKTDPNAQYVNRYFIQKIVDTNPILIKEINEENNKQMQSNPLYKIITIKWDTIYNNDTVIEEAEKQMPGIKNFLKDLNYSPYNEEDIYPTDPNLSIN